MLVDKDGEGMVRQDLSSLAEAERAQMCPTCSVPYWLAGDPPGMTCHCDPTPRRQYTYGANPEVHHAVRAAADHLVIHEIECELARAREKYGPFDTAWFACWQISRRAGDAWDRTRQGQGKARLSEDARRKLIQVAAMALRTLVEFG